MTDFAPVGGAGDAFTPELVLDSTAGSSAAEAAHEVVADWFDELTRRTDLANAASVMDGATIAGLGAGMVTPEMVLAIARHRINDLDEQVSTLMDELTRRTEAASTTSQHLGELRNISAMLEPAYDSNGNLNLDHMVTVEGVGEQSVRAYLASLEAQEILTPTDHAAIAEGREGLQNLIDNANDELRDINSGNEMLMISLQSTMQARTSVVQTATNLLKAIDEGNDSIVGNLR